MLSVILNIPDSSGKEKNLKGISITSTSDNLSLYDVRIRSIDSKTFVKEMFFIDFAGGDLPESVGYNSAYLVDNGEGSDRRAGDGIYTTTTTFNHDDQTPFENIGTPKSILEKPIVNKGFSQIEAFISFAKK